MSAFDLVFALFGLLLGMAIAEVLGGFSRALKLKRKARPVRIGWLTPLLGIFVMLDLTSFWLMAWEARDQVGANYATMVAVLVIVGIYFLAATLIFPEEPEEWPDFDDWYDKQKRPVVAGLLSANVMSWIGQIILEEMHPTPEMAMDEMMMMVVGFAGLGLIGVLIALMRVRGRRTNLVMLVSAIALLCTVGVGEDLL